MGLLFSRARGGSEAAEGSIVLASEVEVIARSACTPGTSRVRPPLPPKVPALAPAYASEPTCAHVAGAR